MAPLVIQSYEDEGQIVSNPYILQEGKLLTNSNNSFANSLHCPINQQADNDDQAWTASKSSSLYRVDGWGAPYFFVSPKGQVAVHPNGHRTKLNDEINLINVIKQMVKPKVKGGLGLTTPAILRFPDVLKHRLHTLQSCFDNAIKLRKFQGCFKGVFPVKCNQNHSVIDNIVEFGNPFAFGLEAGSKPELLLAMTALSKGNPNALLVCNGYKDADYVCLALIARHIGLNCIIVLEQEEELDLVMAISKTLSIEPVIGLRAKLNTKHAGHFGDTSGENGKFGLSCSEIVVIVNKLYRMKMLSSLQLLHFHIGSQIPSLAILKDGVSEAAQIYCELALMGANMRFIDIGGGLGIDYDGTNSSNSDMSVGYSMEEYAIEVVKAVQDACSMKGVQHPTLCSESGRALVSHHSVLVFDVLSSSRTKNHMVTQGVSLEVEGLPADLKSLHTSLIGFAKACDYQGALECAKLLKHGCIELFKQGKLGLAQLACVNSIYEVVCEAGDVDNKHRTTSAQSHNAVYHVNLSLFRCMPDTWAIGQLFPIIPLHRLEEEPKVRAILSDLTCDSDGKVVTFVGKDNKGRRVNYLRVHELEEGKPYYMGMFLGGAYQEALGNLHNLFGTPHVVNVYRGAERDAAEFELVKASDGQTAADVLKLMQYEPTSMLETLKLQIQKSLNCGKEEEAMGLIQSIASSFGASTYLSTNHPRSSILSKGFLSTSSTAPPSSPALLQPLV
ncbi:hypothetical protein GOP47_0002444 [Adiantum capillus-veneris]|uniref:Arginine decarboxylase n=1 Tax=Adiantum capillus-veneris TaxID=13818 RepID=A0A9D4VBL3_ADICA|nr:hypothetical protein GOP47_0002444 [Adiantum capillus-veneris]